MQGKHSALRGERVSRRATRAPRCRPGRNKNATSGHKGYAARIGSAEEIFSAAIDPFLDLA
jgi:hypothetical protein